MLRQKWSFLTSEEHVQGENAHKHLQSCVFLDREGLEENTYRIIVTDEVVSVLPFTLFLTVLDMAIY